MARPLIVSVRADFYRAQAKLDALAKKQLPFAAAQALTATAKEAGAVITAHLPEDIDRPTPFTMRAVGIKAARKNNLQAEIFIRRIQARYLAPTIRGENQIPAKSAVLVPKDISENEFGNLPRRAVRSLKSDPSVFIGMVTPKGGQAIGGVWRRTGDGHLQLLVRFTEGVRLRKRFDFDARARVAIGERFPPNLERALAAAIATAK